QFAGDRLEQRGLAGAVAADEARLRARRKGQRGVVEKQAARNAERYVVKDKHGAALLTERRRERKGRRGRSTGPELSDPAAAVPGRSPRNAPPHALRCASIWARPEPARHVPPAAGRGVFHADPPRRSLRRAGRGGA